MVIKMAARRHIPTVDKQVATAIGIPFDADSDAALLVERSTTAQELPTSVSDSSVLDRVARLVRASDPTGGRAARSMDYEAGSR